MITSVLLLILMLAASGWSGMLIVARFLSRPLSFMEKTGLFVVWGPLFLSLTSLCLADAGCFSIRNIYICLTVWLALGILCCFKARRRMALANVDSKNRRGEVFVSLFYLLLIGGMLYARPFQYLRGGLDPGEYISTAMNISRTGSIRINDKFISSLDAEHREVLFHEKEGPRKTLQAGYLVVNEDKGRVVPDYFHLYPAWMAIFAGLFGLSGVYYGQYVIALYALVVFFLAIRQIFGRTVAEISGLILVLSPAQAYFARFSGAEMLTQFMLFSMFLHITSGLKNPAWPHDLTGALALAAAFLAHSTSILVIAGVILFLFIYAMIAGQKRVWRILCLAIVFLALAFLRNLFMAGTMTGFLFAFLYEHLKLIVPGFSVIILIVLAAILLLKMLRENKLPLLENEWITRWGPGVIVLAAGLFLYFLRPRFFPGQEAGNMMLIGWLVSPVGLVLCAVFFFRQSWGKWTAEQWLFMVCGAVACSVLIAHKMIHPQYMWSIRRYVPFVVPFFCALAAVPVADLCSGRSAWRKAGGAVLIVIIAAYLGWQSFPIVKIREYQTLPDFVQRVAGHLKDADFVLCDHWKYSTPLRYAFGLPAYQLSRQQEGCDIDEARKASEILEGVLKAGSSNVYYAGTAGPFFNPAFYLEHTAYESSKSPRLIANPHHLPRTGRYELEKANVYKLKQTGRVFVYPLEPVVFDIGYHSLGLIKGFHSMQKGADSETFRWTAGRAGLYMPSFGVRAVTRYTFRLAAKRPPEMGGQPVPVDVYVNDAKIDTVNVGQDWGEYSAEFSTDDPEVSTVILELTAPEWNPADYGIRNYPADLGVRVDWIKAEPVGGGVELI